LGIVISRLYIIKNELEKHSTSGYTAIPTNIKANQIPFASLMENNGINATDSKSKLRNVIEEA
jgi:hypothetical protein